MYKQVILVRTDLKMPKGKLAVQVAHASVDASLTSNKEIVEKWQAEGMKKVALKVENLDELLKYKKLSEAYKIKTALIKDAGKTFLNPGTITCLAIGPDKEDKIDMITKDLKMV
jgi:peptidyl-tRNA hydrolase, PTH2 family